MAASSLTRLTFVAIVACNTPPPLPADAVEHTFALDVDHIGERFVCFGFDASQVAGQSISAIRWTAPAPGESVELHHATLFAYPTDYPDGPVDCNEMPLQWQVHTYFAGGDPLVLNEDTGLRLATDAKRLVLHMHVLRKSAGPPGAATLRIELRQTPPVHEAILLPTLGLVPAIRPHMEESTTSRCRASANLHVVATAPHMHTIGKSFTSNIERPSVVDPLVSVPTWVFDRQASYRVDKDLAAGDVVTSTCTWYNPTDQYVLPGVKTSDEMCGQALLVWPASAARWDGDCF